jgi:hypothetical protein
MKLTKTVYCRTCVSLRSVRQSESESELLYDWRFTANQFVLAQSPLRLTTSNFIFQLNTCGYNPHVTYSLTRGWVRRLQLLVLASAVILRSESRATSDSRLHQPGGPGPRIYIPQALGSPSVSFYDSQGYGGLHTRCLFLLQLFS